MIRSKKRFIYMAALGIVITIALNIFVPDQSMRGVGLFDFLGSILITVIIWEGNLRIDHWLNHKYPWIKSPLKRLIIHFLLSVGYSAVLIFILSFIFNMVIHEMDISKPEFFRLSMIILGALVLMSFILLTFEISAHFFEQWKNSVTEIEKYRAENLQAQLQNLKNQINPHFLFNNLSVLSSLVYQDADKSVEFINQLSKVYRYLLDNQNNELVPLDEEIRFIHSYIFLLMIRFSPNLQTNIEMEPGTELKLIPPMALQILVENAIRHNEISTSHPLKISIVSQQDKLVVTNNLQRRQNYETGSGTGLKNIQSRYAFFTEIPVKTMVTDESFIVEIPLLTRK